MRLGALTSGAGYPPRMTTVFIDGDACPVTRDAISVARSAGANVVIVSNDTQSHERYTTRGGVEAVQVGAGRDSADFAIVERLSPGDVVVTGDIGLAAMVLGRGARALGPRGREFSLATIDAELAVRHAEQRERRRGGRVRGGPPPYQDDDRDRFRAVLARLLRER